MRPDVLDRFAAVTETIREPEQLRTYECDGLTGRRVVPALVALPANAAEVQAVVRVCNEEGIPFVARGAGTGLSGGALPVAEGIVISLARLTRILEIDLERAQVVVEPGVANLDVTRAVAAAGFYYAPDPSSQQVCTIGGNVAENSGGAHCLKYGFTVNHVLAAEVVLPDGDLVELSVWDDGPDLLGVFVGSEGTLGIASDPQDRFAVWRGRKAAFAAMGRVSPDYYVQDGVVPRTKLPEVLRRIDELSAEHGLRVGNVFHAGDGNLHPLVLYDVRIEGQAERAEELAQQILVACVDAGGSITGEHGVGADKACAMPLMFGEDDIAAMLRVRAAFDPAGLANPGKLFPTPRLCGEVPGPYRAHPLEKAGLAQRL